MKKLKKIGGLSFGSQEAYDNFLSLPKEEQLKQVTASFSPQDEARAVEALKGVKNGDSERVATENTSNNVADATGSDAKDSRKGRGAGTEKGEN